jgi:hypothetical protein
VRIARLSSAEVAQARAADLAGAVLLATVRLPSGSLPKGTRLTPADIDRLIDAGREGVLPTIRLAWPEPGDVHEDEASARLARAVGGAGIELRPPRQSRVDLAARWDGVLQVHESGLRAVNAIDPLEVFTVFHGQAVVGGQVVAAVKVAPHLVTDSAVRAGERAARQHGPLVEVRPYRPQEVAAIAMEAIAPDALDRFERGAQAKIEALGCRYGGAVVIPETNPAVATRRAADALAELTESRRIRVVLVAGVSAGDPLSPFWDALAQRGGRVVRRGVPAHPGSMIWVAALGDSQVLGLPTCGMFTLATAADLVLPRLLSGERVSAESLADLGHGGMLTREMRFRFPAYARDLGAPEG